MREDPAEKQAEITEIRELLRRRRQEGSLGIENLLLSMVGEGVTDRALTELDEQLEKMPRRDRKDMLHKLRSGKL